MDTHTSEFNDVNAYQEIVGRGTAPSGQMRALYKVPGTGKDTGYYDLGVLSGGTNSVAKGISNNGLIVGQSGMLVGAGQVARAFVVSNAGTPGSQPLVNLNDNTYVIVNGQPVLATTQGWTLLSAERVSRAGWIAGYGVKAGVNRAFVLSPR